MKKINMVSLQILHICLLFITFQEIGGVQFKHFPIANGRSESDGPAKFQPRQPSPPTGRPASSHDINPFNLSHLQVEEEPRANRGPIRRGQGARTLDTRGQISRTSDTRGQALRTSDTRSQVSRTTDTRGQVPRTSDIRSQVSRTTDTRGQTPRRIDQRPATFVVGTTDSRPFIRDQRPTTVDTRPTTIEGFDSRGQPIAQGPSDRRPIALEEVQSRGRSGTLTPNPIRPTEIEGFDNRGRPVTHVGRTRTGLPGRVSETQRPTVQTNEIPTTKSRIAEQRRKINQPERLSKEKTVRSRGRLPLKNKNQQQINISKRQRGQENVSSNLRKSNVSEQRRFSLPQRAQQIDVITEANLNRARARPIKENNRKVLRVGQKRRKQSGTKVQSQRANQTPRKIQSFQTVPVAKPQQPKQKVIISKPDEINEILMTEIREKMKKHSHNLMTDDQRKIEKPKTIGRFPNFGQASVKTKQNHDIALKQKIKEKNTDNEEMDVTFTSHSTERVKDKFMQNVPVATVPESKQFNLPEQNQPETDNEQIKLVPGVVWLNGKKVWETSFLVRDEEEERRRVDIELENSKHSQININVAMDHTEKITQNNKPKNAFFEIGKSEIEGKRKENKPATNPSVMNSQEMNVVPAQTPIRTQPSTQKPLRNLPSINLTAKSQSPFQSPQIEHTNQNKHRNTPQNVKPRAKLPFEKPIIQSTIIRQTPIISTARQPPTNIPQRKVLPTQSSFRNPPTQALFFQNPPTQVPFRNQPTQPNIQSPSTKPPFRNRLSFQKPSTQQLTLRNPPTQTPLITRPIQANVARQEIGRSREQNLILDTNQADALAFLPLSFNQEFDDSGAISIDWGR